MVVDGHGRFFVCDGLVVVTYLFVNEEDIHVGDVFGGDAEVVGDLEVFDGDEKLAEYHLLEFSWDGGERGHGG